MTSDKGEAFMAWLIVAPIVGAVLVSDRARRRDALEIELAENHRGAHAVQARSEQGDG